MLLSQNEKLFCVQLLLAKNTKSHFLANFCHFFSFLWLRTMAPISHLMVSHTQAAKLLCSSNKGKVNDFLFLFFFFFAKLCEKFYLFENDVVLLNIKSNFVKL